MTSISRKDNLLRVSRAGQAPSWSFLTNHGRALLCIAHDPAIRLREIAEQLGITERAAYRIVDDLVSAEYVSRRRNGRRNHYTVHQHLPLPDRLPRTKPVGELLAILGPPAPAPDVRDLSDASREATG